MTSSRRPPASLIQGGYDSLIQGISQQPAHLRTGGQADDQVNGWSSPVDGLGKRQNTVHVGRVFPSSDAADFFLETMPVAQGERYSVYVQPSADGGGIAGVLLNSTGSVIDVHGAGLSIDIIGQTAYVKGAPSSYLAIPSSETYRGSFVLVNNGPLGLLLNRQRTTEWANLTTPAAVDEALVFIQGIDYQVTYSIDLGFSPGIAPVSHTTPKATDANNQLDTSAVVADLVSQLQALSPPGGGAFTFTQGVNVIYIKRIDGQPFTISVSDGRSGTLARAIYSSVNSFSLLPTEAMPGFRVKIDADPSNELDNYYVEFVGTSGSAGQLQSGFWQEVAAPGIRYRISADTMPLVIRRAAPGVVFIGPADGATRSIVTGGNTYTYTFPNWTDRSAGDDVTVPAPSFIGKQIRDLALFRGRMALVAGESIIMSRTSNLFAFFNETAVSVLDTDPIDVVAAGETRSSLNWILPLEENLLAFSDLAQFQLKVVDGEVLTPRTAFVVRLSNIQMNSLVRPKLAGPNILFATYQHGYSGFREYAFFASSARRLGLNLGASNDITSYVPKLIQGQVSLMDVGESADTMACNNPSDGSEVFIYKYLFETVEQGMAKQQASWSRWKFDGEVRWLRFFENQLWLVIAYGDGTYSCRVDLDETIDPQGHRILLDRAIDYPECNYDAAVTNDIIASYDAVTGKTTFALPYMPASELVAVTRYDDLTRKGLEIGRTSGGNVLTVIGDWTQRKLTFGCSYEFRYEFGTIYKMTRSQNMNKLIGDVTGRLQIRRWLMNHYQTGRYEVDVALKNRPVTTHIFESRFLNIDGNRLNDQGQYLDTGSFGFPVAAKNTDFSVTLKSSHWLPVRISGITWEGTYTDRASRNH